MVDRLQGDDVDLPALGHPPHVTGVAGDDGDLVRVRLQLLVAPVPRADGFSSRYFAA
jgi:hypothetical protein